MMSYSVTRTNKKQSTLVKESPPKISRRKSSPRKLLRRNSSNKEQSSTGSASDIKSDDYSENNKKREVFILPDSLLPSTHSEKSSSCPDFVPLRHPKTGCKAVFMFAKDNSQVCELLRYTDGHRSWFIGDSVEEDGSIVVSTPIDPLFLVIPYLQKTDKFMLLDQAVKDEDFPECVRILSCPKFTERITKILDSKDCGSEKAYRLNQSKVLEWLKVKVEKLAALLKEKNYHVGGGSQLATFVRSKKDRGDEKEAYTSYAAGIISEYIPEDLSKELQKYLSVDDEDETSSAALEPQTKKAKLSSPTEPSENYSDSGSHFEMNKSTLKPKKLTPAQKMLKKTDKKGMKSISSFFNKK